MRHDACDKLIEQVIERAEFAYQAVSGSQDRIHLKDLLSLVIHRQRRMLSNVSLTK